MKLFSIFLLVLITGCSTVVPVTQRFPEAPAVLLEPCSQLKMLDQNVGLVELTKVVVENYSKYHECGLLVEAWQTWYRNQEKIYKELK